MDVLEAKLTDDEYLRQIEILAREVVDAASSEGWLSYQPDPAEATPLQKAVNELARRIRHWHFQGDGCVDDSPLLHLAGANLFRPDDDYYYAWGCARLGISERPEGWALWFTWDDKSRPSTLVTTALETTKALLENWARGIDVHPAQLSKSQIAAVHSGWIGPRVLSPSHADTRGLGGR